jgi:hypothetical protein
LIEASGCHPGKHQRLVRRLVAAPGDVHVGPQQDQVLAVELARALVRKIEDAEMRSFAD